MTTLRCCLPVLLASSLTLVPMAFAQPKVAPSQSEKTDELVQLSEFSVTEKADTGYIASESVTGTRVRTQIKDLPFSVSVITSEFMQDFDFFDLAKDMAYTANLNGVDTQGNSNLRGYGATFYLRNGFYRLGLVDRVNTDRVEVIKGPNAAIYGQTSPAGLINIVTKLPKFNAATEKLTFTAGGNEFNRVEMNVNTPLGSIGGVQVANLFSAEGNNFSTETTYGRQRNRLIDDNILFKFRDGSTLNFEVEWSKRKEVTSTSQIPFEYNIAKKLYSDVQRKDLAYFSQGGPDSVQNRELVSFYLTYDKRFNSVWSTHAGTYRYARHAFNFNNSSTDQYDPSTGKFNRSTNVLVDPLNEDGGAAQVDLLAEYSALDGKLKNKTLLTADYSQNWRYRQQDGVNTRIYTIGIPSLINPDYSLPPRSAFNIVTRNDKVRWDIKGFLLRQQTTMFNDRLIAFATLRHDAVTYNFNFGNQYNRAGGALATPGAVSHYTDTAWSPNLGLNFKATPHLALYASHATSFSPAGQVAKLGDPHIENETSVGWDYGIKASFLDSRLVFTTGGFYIDRNGVKTSQVNPITGLKETVAAGKQVTKGVEFEGAWRVTDALTVQASYGYVNAKILYNGSATTDVGQMPAGLPVDQGSLIWTYHFSRGMLKGLSWNSGIVYSGVSYPNSTATDARRTIDAPSYYIVNMGLSYSWRARDRKLGQSVRVSAKNLLDRDYEDQKGGLGAPRGIFFAYTLSH